MKLNYIGIIGAIIAFVSIALPWWTVSETSFGFGTTSNWFLYNAGTSGAGLNLWYNWVALLLVILAGIIGLAGSIIPDDKKMLMGGGILALLSIIIFAAGLQTDLSSHNSTFGVFSSGTMFGVASFSTYLSYGFWLTLVAAIIMLVAMRYPKVGPQAPAPPPSPPPPTTGTQEFADIN